MLTGIIRFAKKKGVLSLSKFGEIAGGFSSASESAAPGLSRAFNVMKCVVESYRRDKVDRFLK